MNHFYRITRFSTCHQKKKQKQQKINKSVATATNPPRRSAVLDRQALSPICLPQTTISPSNPEITERKQPIRTSGMDFCPRSLNRNNGSCVFYFFWTVLTSRWQCYPCTSTILAAIKLVDVLPWVDPIDLQLSTQIRSGAVPLILLTGAKRKRLTF